jgi:hypothetical protein
LAATEAYPFRGISSKTGAPVDFAVERSNSPRRPEPSKALAGGAGGNYFGGSAAATED